MNTPYLPYRKGTVLAPSGPVDHLHIICSDPIYSAEHGCDVVLVVNISSVPTAGPYDNSCVLRPGDHPFVRHQSYLVYSRAVLWRCPAITDKVGSGEYRTHEDLSESVMLRVIEGFNSSLHTAFKIVRFVQRHAL